MRTVLETPMMTFPTTCSGGPFLDKIADHMYSFHKNFTSQTDCPLLCTRLHLVSLSLFTIDYRVSCCTISCLAISSPHFLWATLALHLRLALNLFTHHCCVHFFLRSLTHSTFLRLKVSPFLLLHSHVTSNSLKSLSYSIFPGHCPSFFLFYAFTDP